MITRMEGRTRSGIMAWVVSCDLVTAELPLQGSLGLEDGRRKPGRTHAVISNWLPGSATGGDGRSSRGGHRGPMLPTLLPGVSCDGRVMSAATRCLGVQSRHPVLLLRSSVAGRVSQPGTQLGWRSQWGTVS
ncbi:hypothetical protein M758_3G073400 [Ceratodon purpureus]|nr:hypothetical protein M758_3G073400 [Ceratodon purpureus]